MSQDNIWTTADGELLDIAWMTSPHIAHSINLVIRKNSLKKIDASILLEPIREATKPGLRIFGRLGQELRDRGLFRWSAHQGGVSTYLVVPDARETFEQLCLIRALIDTGSQWHGTSSFHDAMSCIRYQFEAAVVDLENCIKRQWYGHERASAIMAKYMQYRLEPRRNP